MIETLSKRRIAQDQIIGAVEMYERARYVCATTLAGAADEILGSLLRKKGVPTGHELCIDRDERLWDFAGSRSAEVAKMRPTRKEIGRRLNRSRNEFKHNDTGSGLNRRTQHVLEFEAEEMLMRAIGNYYRLYRQLPKKKVLRKWAEYHLCLVVN
jgi:hypothetical protein